VTQPIITYAEPVPIDGFGPGFFRIAGQVVTGNLLVLPTAVTPWGGFTDTGSILAASADLDVVFVGTGPDIAHLPTDFVDTLQDAGLGVEPMATASACRLYNVLLSEGRRVACALLSV